MPAELGVSRGPRILSRFVLVPVRRMRDAALVSMSRSVSPIAPAGTGITAPVVVHRERASNALVQKATYDAKEAIY